MGDFKPGIGHLAVQNRTPVIPMHVRGSHRVMPKGRSIPLPAPVKIRIGRPLTPGQEETSKAFAVRIESAVRGLADGSESPELTGTWIDRWRATEPRSRSKT